MDDLPPDWAVERVKVLHREAGGCTTPMAYAFAHYIAEHEEAPVDPLLIEAREIVYLENVKNPDYEPFANEVREGQHDRHGEIKVAIAALRRGIEIGKAMS